MHHPVVILQAQREAVTSRVGGKCLFVPLLGNNRLLARTARLPALQLVLTASSSEAGKAGVGCWAWQGESTFNSPSTMLVRTHKAP